MKIRNSRTLVLACLLTACLASNSSAQTTIEVDVEGTFTPLDKAVVPTATPTIRITRDVDIPPDFSVLLTRPGCRAPSCRASVFSVYRPNQSRFWVAATQCGKGKS